MTDMVAGKGKAVQEPLRVYTGLKSVTTRREAGSPAWLPHFGGGAVVRFTNQTDHLGEPAGSWGPYTSASRPVPGVHTGSSSYGMQVMR